MSYSRSFLSALHRSVDVLKHNTASVLRMDLTASAQSQGPLHIWSISRPQDLSEFATGCDRDIGGLSTMKLDVAQGAAGKGPDDVKRADGHGRFWGTISNQVPRSAKMEKSGYAGMRNKNRPTLFGAQTWDVSLYSHLALRLRNSLALPSSGNPSLSSALSAASMLGTNISSLTALQRAKTALGFGIQEPPGPKYFLNIQTDGPITSDLFQHRIWFDPGAKDEWQTVVIPLSHFLMINTGTLSEIQLTMMKEAIRTVGISCVLDSPRLVGRASEVSEDRATSTESQASTSSTTGEAPSALRRPAATEEESAPQRQSSRGPVDETDDWARDGQLRDTPPLTDAMRGNRRAQSFRFDLRIQAIHAVGSVEEAQELWS